MRFGKPKSIWIIRGSDAPVVGNVVLVVRPECKTSDHIDRFLSGLVRN